MSSKPFPIARARGTREAFTLKQRGRSSGFTLVELLVSVFVLAIIILMIAQLMNSAAAVTRTGHKHISTDTQARTVFDQMAVDFAQMLKRNDVDYYVKGTLIITRTGTAMDMAGGTGGEPGNKEATRLRSLARSPATTPPLTHGKARCRW